MSEFTPGPWKAVDGRIFSQSYLTKTPLAKTYRQKHGGNAALIAAAPDLLEALTRLLAEVDKSGNGTATDYGWPVAVAKAREAITNATNGN